MHEALASIDGAQDASEFTHLVSSPPCLGHLQRREARVVRNLYGPSWAVLGRAVM